jgi:hypothetical protein
MKSEMIKMRLIPRLAIVCLGVVQAVGTVPPLSVQNSLCSDIITHAVCCLQSSVALREAIWLAEESLPITRSVSDRHGVRELSAISAPLKPAKRQIIGPCSRLRDKLELAALSLLSLSLGEEQDPSIPHLLDEGERRSEGGRGSLFYRLTYTENGAQETNIAYESPSPLPPFHQY